MGLLDGLLGGIVGAEMATVVNSFIQQHGGVQGVAAALEQQGLGGVVRSWIGSGPNQPISAGELSRAFDNSAVLAQLAGKVGMSPQELSDSRRCCRQRSTS